MTLSNLTSIPLVIYYGGVADRNVTILFSSFHLQRAYDVWYPLPSDAPVDPAGYIDGLFGDEIRGWVADVANPERPITVCIRINDVFAGKITACQHRGDIAEILGSRGLHGFAFRVPDRFFRNEVWSLEVLLQDGRHLPPRPLQIEAPSVNRRVSKPVRSPCLLFIHIPKTAGTALRKALSEETGQSRHLMLYPHAPGFRGEYLFCLSESQLASIECVYGHFGFRLHKFMPQPCEYAAVLREPVARTISHFLQLQRTFEPGSHPATSMSADEFFAGTTDSDFDNLMTRLVSGETADILPFGDVNESVFQHAIDNLHSWFCYAGLQEKVDEVQEQMADRLGLPLKSVLRENVGEARERASISSRSLARMRQLNEYDTRLYEYVRDKFWASGARGWVRPQNIPE